MEAGHYTLMEHQENQAAEQRIEQVSPIEASEEPCTSPSQEQQICPLPTAAGCLASAAVSDEKMPQSVDIDTPKQQTPKPDAEEPVAQLPSAQDTAEDTGVLFILFFCFLLTSPIPKWLRAVVRSMHATNEKSSLH